MYIFMENYEYEKYYVNVHLYPELWCTVESEILWSDKKIRK